MDETQTKEQKEKNALEQQTRAHVRSVVVPLWAIFMMNVALFIWTLLTTQI